jgi:type IX secretion system PorP/SprF family membrane protein
MKKILLFLNLFFLVCLSYGQQDPQYTHYMYNMSVINPAYATSKEAMLDLGTLYRSQWVGAVGAPRTITLFGHMPVNKKIELGLSLISDDIGDGAKKENNVYADFAYVLQLRNKHRLSFGLKAGFSTIGTNFNGFKLESGNNTTDNAFNNNINTFTPNIGAGVFYYSNSYYIGLSAPNLLPTKHIEDQSGIAALGSERIHTFLTAGYVLGLSDTFKVKPAFMAKYVFGTPVSVDLSTNVLYNNKFELGVAYRIKDAVSGLMGVNITRTLKIGYAYDYTLSNLGQFNSGSHELFLLFNLDLLGRGYDKSPRFF